MQQVRVLPFEPGAVHAQQHRFLLRIARPPAGRATGRFGGENPGRGQHPAQQAKALADVRQNVCSRRQTKGDGASSGGRTSAVVTGRGERAVFRARGGYTRGCTISIRTPSGPTTNEISMSSPSGFVNGRGSIVNSTPLALISSAAARRSGYCQPR